jgi:hypothetical protein
MMFLLTREAVLKMDRVLWVLRYREPKAEAMWYVEKESLRY